MHRIVKMASTLLATAMWIGIACGNDDSTASWHSLPLIKDGKVDPNWVHVGWGGFVVDKDSLRTECDEKGMGLLLYKPEPFGNCQIRVTYKSTEPKSNSGVFIRIDPGVIERLNEKPTPVQRNNEGKLSKGSLDQLMKASEAEQGPWYAVHHGYEVQICDSSDANHRTGSIYSLAKADAFEKDKSSDWNTMVITLDGNVVLVEMNGKPVSRFDSNNKDIPERHNWYEPKRDPKRPITGYIGLQNHDPGDIVYFKEVSVGPLTSARDKN